MGQNFGPNSPLQSKYFIIIDKFKFEIDTDTEVKLYLKL